MGHHGPDFTKAIESIPGRTVPSQVKMAALGLIAVGIAAVGYGIATDPHRTSGAFITNFMYFNGIAMGGFMLTPIAMVTHSRWPRRVKRFSESFAFFLPVMWVLFAIFAFSGGVDVYPWVEEGARGELPPHKAVYLTKGFFIARQLIGQGILMVLALLMARASLNSDIAMAKEHLGDKAPKGWPWNGNVGPAKAAAEKSYMTQLKLAPVVCIAYAAIYTMIAVDVSMSLAPHWYANMFPAWLFMSSIWSGLVYIALFSLIGREWLGVRELIGSNVYHDLGKLTFAFCMFWGYTTFAQYLPIWYGNMIEEIGFVLIRTAMHPWDRVAQAVFLLCFLAPWTILLSRGLKKIPSAYISVACVIAVGIWLERFLTNMPSIWMEDTLPLGFIEIGMAAGLLGAFILVVTTVLSKVPGAVISDRYMQPDPDHVHVLPKSHGGHH
ncbi:MAG: hypothetical protein P8R54_08525 [Myxococcota bacterium]|nr:hypothetical protein [Myxococcota bacterium]